MTKSPAHPAASSPGTYEENELVRLLKTLQPGDERIHTRTIDPTPGYGRFLLIGSRTDLTRFYQEEPYPAPAPLIPINHDYYRPLSADPPPRFVVTGKPNQIGDLHLFGFIQVVSPRVLECILKLDPDSIEIRQADLIGDPLPDPFYMIMPRRVIDAVDLQRTTVRLKCWLLPPDNRPGRTATFPGGGLVGQLGFTIKADMPQHVHLFMEPCSGEILWSRALWDCVAAAEAKGLYARSPEDFTGISHLEI